MAKQVKQNNLTGILTVCYDEESIISMSVPDGKFRNEFTCEMNGQKFRLVMELIDDDKKSN